MPKTILKKKKPQLTLKKFQKVPENHDQLIIKDLNNISNQEILLASQSDIRQITPWVTIPSVNYTPELTYLRLPEKQTLKSKKTQENFAEIKSCQIDKKPKIQIKKPSIKHSLTLPRFRLFNKDENRNKVAKSIEINKLKKAASQNIKNDKNLALSCQNKINLQSVHKNTKFSGEQHKSKKKISLDLKMKKNIDLKKVEITISNFQQDQQPKKESAEFPALQVIKSKKSIQKYKETRTIKISKKVDTILKIAKIQRSFFNSQLKN